MNEPDICSVCGQEIRTVAVDEIARRLLAVDEEYIDNPDGTGMRHLRCKPPEVET